MAAHRQSSPELSQQWQTLRGRYLERLAEKRAEFERAAERLTMGEAEDTAAERIVADMHQLAGSGGTFGFRAVSDVARSAEDKIKSAPGPEEIARIVRTVIDEIGRTLAAERSAVSQSSAPPIPAASKIASAETTGAIPAERPRVLIAEDDVIFAELLEGLFGEEIEVHAVHDGKDVLAAIAAVRPAMVLLDDGLPNTSGLELVEVLAASGGTRDVGVVMLTANDAPQSILRAVRAGAVDYLVKPVDPVALVRTIRDRLEKSAQTVLVVDDDPLVRQLVRDGFRAAGYRVVEAGDGESGLAEARTVVPDLIVLDRMMPGLEGGAVLHQLQNEAETRGIPVIVLTAKAGTGDSLTFLERGVADFMTKPFNPDELVLRGRRIMGRSDDR